MGLLHPGILLGVTFGVLGGVFYVLSFRIKPHSWWREMAGLDDASLGSLAMRARQRRSRIDA